jgi:Thiopurine S-methyltransferase (TPMT)
MLGAAGFARPLVIAFWLERALLMTEPSVGQNPERGKAMTGSAKWDERYLSLAQLWSGKPSAALVVEVAELECGRALDVGCGEGEDAVWLAGQGWDVSARGVSQVALAWGHFTLGTRGGRPGQRG